MTLLEVSNKSFAAKADFVLDSIVPSVCFRLLAAGWYVVTKGKILLLSSFSFLGEVRIDFFSEIKVAFYEIQYQVTLFKKRSKLIGALRPLALQKE